MRTIDWLKVFEQNGLYGICHCHNFKTGADYLQLTYVFVNKTETLRLDITKKNYENLSNTLVDITLGDKKYFKDIKICDIDDLLNKYRVDVKMLDDFRYSKKLIKRKEKDNE